MYWIVLPLTDPGKMKKMVDRARFELAASWMQTMRSAGLIYRPTDNEESIIECFNPYALICPHAGCRAIRGLPSAEMLVQG